MDPSIPLSPVPVSLTRWQRIYRFLGGRLNSTSNIVESVWPKVPAKAMFVIRSVIFLFLLATMILRMILWMEGGKHLFLFTNLTYISLVFYFGIVLAYTWSAEYGKGRFEKGPVGDIEMQQMGHVAAAGNTTAARSPKDLTHPDSQRNQFVCWLISLQ